MGPLLFLKSLDLKSWIIIALIAALVGMWTVVQFRNIKVSRLENSVKEKELVIVGYKQQVSTLSDAITKQNEAVEALAQRNSEFEASLNNTNVQNKKLTASAETLIKYIKGSFVPPDCSGAVTHLNEFTKEFAKDWNKK